MSKRKAGPPHGRGRVHFSFATSRLRSFLRAQLGLEDLLPFSPFATLHNPVPAPAICPSPGPIRFPQLRGRSSLGLKIQTNLRATLLTCSTPSAGIHHSPLRRSVSKDLQLSPSSGNPHYVTSSFSYLATVHPPLQKLANIPEELLSALPIAPKVVDTEPYQLSFVLI